MWDAWEVLDELRDALYLLQRWYSMQSDGAWEHDFGIDIGPLDHPGWTLIVELARTPLAHATLEPSEIKRSHQDWLDYRVEAQRFQAICGPTNLNEAILAFLDFAGVRDDLTSDPSLAINEQADVRSANAAERRARIRELQRQAAARRDPAGWAATLTERLGSIVGADQIADLQTTDAALALLAANAPRHGVNEWTPQDVRRVVTRDRDAWWAMSTRRYRSPLGTSGGSRNRKSRRPMRGTTADRIPRFRPRREPGRVRMNRSRTRHA